MGAALLLVLVSALGVVAAFVVPGMSDLILLAGPCLLAALFVLWRIWRKRADPKAALRLILIDGSNVMHWRDNTPQIETVREVVTHLTALGYTPMVMFDANAGYLLAGRYQHDGALAERLGLLSKNVLVVPKGTPADPMLLNVARDYKARIVTNDRFRDWADDHPEVHEPGFLIRGGYHEGKLSLELDAATR